MTILPPQCLACIHLSEGGPLTCAAYPKGIPTAILDGRHDHREPWPGDKGIRFQPRPDTTITIDALLAAQQAVSSDDLE